MKSKLRPIIAIPLIFVMIVLFMSDTLGTARNHKVWNGYASHTINSFKSYGPANKPIDFANIDYGLLQAAVFFETNRMRQQKGKSLLIHSPGLEKAAMMHAMDMADRNFFSHDNPYDAKKKRFTDRTSMFGAKGAAENIATTFGIQYKAGTSVSNVSAIPPHTYNSFAAALVDGWMNSSGHRANILDEKGLGYKYLGCGVYPIPGDKWRKFYGVQNFAYSVSADDASTAGGTAAAGKSGDPKPAPSVSVKTGMEESYYITQFEYFTGKNGVWSQKLAAGKTHTFAETKRDDEYIYIHDKSRNVSIALPINGGPSYLKEPGMKSFQKWLSVRK